MGQFEMRRQILWAWLLLAAGIGSTTVGLCFLVTGRTECLAVGEAIAAASAHGSHVVIFCPVAAYLGGAPPGVRVT